MKTVNHLILLLFVLTIGVNAQNKIESKNSRPTIVFVHGLWADGSCWNNVISNLQTEGYKVVSVQNPTTSFEDDVAATKRALDRTEGPVILVGHSWGGFIITEVGNDPRVKGLVYVAALAPDADETILTLSSKAPSNDLGKYLQAKDGFITLSLEGMKKSFAGDLNSKQQSLLYATQTPASQSVFGAKMSIPAWKQKPSWYIIAKNDGAINPDLQRIMAKRMNAKTITSNSSHVVMFAKPQDVLTMVKAAAKYNYEK